MPSLKKILKIIKYRPYSELSSPTSEACHLVPRTACRWTVISQALLAMLLLMQKAFGLLWPYCWLTIAGHRPAYSSLFLMGTFPAILPWASITAWGCCHPRTAPSTNPAERQTAGCDPPIQPIQIPL